MSSPEQVSREIFALLKKSLTPSEAARALSLASVLLIEQELVQDPTLENVETCAGNMATWIVADWVRLRSH